MKRIFRYGILMIIGMSLCFYGLVTFMVREPEVIELTDQEIVERAKELGMVPITEKLLNTENNE
jgi:hypothetical protein